MYPYQLLSLGRCFLRSCFCNCVEYFSFPDVEHTKLFFSPAEEALTTSLFTICPQFIYNLFAVCLQFVRGLFAIY